VVAGKRTGNGRSQRGGAPGEAMGVKDDGEGYRRRAALGCERGRGREALGVRVREMSRGGLSAGLNGREHNPL